jgi:ABC-type dipeptide/oligopeptide/nickel transport system ATPase component
VNILLFVGHPGHELLAHKFLMKYEPVTVFLTDGSGNSNNPRIEQSIHLLESKNLTVKRPFKPLSDREIYDLLLAKKFEPFIKIKENLKSLINEENVEMIVGDAIEGFNPTHDVCRYITNCIVSESNKKRELRNYDFFQDNVKLNIDHPRGVDDIVLELDKKDLELKLDTCNNYPQIKYEVDKFSQVFGNEFFTTEYFRSVTDTSIIKTWDTEIPFYESFGRKRIAEGVYKKLITFEDHVKPLAEFLFQH